MSFKKEAIAFAETTNNRNAAKKFNVDVKRIREWRQKKADIIETCAKGKGARKAKTKWWWTKDYRRRTGRTPVGMDPWPPTQRFKSIAPINHDKS